MSADSMAYIGMTACCQKIVAAHMIRGEDEARAFADSLHDDGLLVQRVSASEVTPDRWVDDWPHACEAAS